MNYYNVDNEKIVRSCYLKLLSREPDKDALDYFVNLLNSNSINENEIKNQIKNSFEYQLSHPIEIESNTPVDIKMKKEWEARTKLQLRFWKEHFPNDLDFWNSGTEISKKILGITEQRFSKITQNNEPKNMKILEIGCGIGRILIPMSKIFGEVIGIDVSSEMVKIGNTQIKNISNCTIFENNGTDLSLFSDNFFNFCYSYVVFQHIPEKEIIEKYVEEVYRVLKPGSLFRFQVRGNVDTKPKEITTWDGVQFTSTEIHNIANANNFEIIEEGNDKTEYYWLTLKSHS